MSANLPSWFCLIFINISERCRSSWCMEEEPVAHAGWETCLSPHIWQVSEPRSKPAVLESPADGFRSIPASVPGVTPLMALLSFVRHKVSLAVIFRAHSWAVPGKPRSLSTVELSRGWVRGGRGLLSEPRGRLSMPFLSCHRTDIQGLALNLARGQAWDWILFLFNAQKPEETGPFGRPYREGSVDMSHQGGSWQRISSRAEGHQGAQAWSRPLLLEAGERCLSSLQTLKDTSLEP